MAPAEIPNDRKTILIVGDAPEDICLLDDILKDQFQVEVAVNSAEAFRIARSPPPPYLILLDMTAPGIDRYEICRHLNADDATRNIPIIILNDKISAEIETLREEVARRIGEITETQEITIHVLASLAETRDVDTGSHILRTQHYVRALAEKLSTHPRFQSVLTPLTIDLLFRSAQLHDIGKVGIPDCILQKPGPLTPEEFEIIKTHTTIGRNVIEHAEERLGRKVEFLTLAKQIAYSHHEKWDGTGYPQGLAGDDIPYAARLMSIADVYDALIQRRVYMGPIPHRKAVAMIQEGRGTKFDPDMMDAFLEIQDEYAAIAARFEASFQN